MKTRYLLLSLACFFHLHFFSQCTFDEVEVSVTITCSESGNEFEIYCYDNTTFTYYYNEPSSPQPQDVQTFCVPIGACSNITIYDNGFGGGYTTDVSITIDGVVVSEGPMANYSYNDMINCSPGSFCLVPQEIEAGNTYEAAFEDTWYTFTPAANGLYEINTCDLNTCDTKIWIYQTCPGWLDEGPPYTYAYNDNSDCGLQASSVFALEGGQQYLIRIGDSYDDCLENIQFTFNYMGVVTGCMDPLACNYQPLAEQDNGNCLYFPNPDCASPDLVMNVETLLTSMYVMDVSATPCDVEEGMVTGDGERTVITFSVRIDNMGDEDYYIGNPTDNPEMFEVVNCHGHVHYAGYGDYRLMDMQGNIIPAGHKNGFCVMDVCGAGQYNCGQMGISAGCYDEYGAGTSGQWFDITNIPDGIYHGLVTVNPLHLPDALGRQESSYDNNTYTFCMEIGSDGIGGRTVQLLSESDCPAFVDCMGVEGGSAIQDCDGACNGPSIWGDVQPDEDLNDDDMSVYLDILTLENIDVTTCNDLSANGNINVYDVVLANICNEASQIGGTSFCDFPHNLISSSSSCGLAITTVNFSEGYVDVELKSPIHDVIAYQFTISGILIESVESLTDVGTFSCTAGFNVYHNSVFGFGAYQQKIENQATPVALCRIHFSQVTGNTICIEGISDIVNALRARTATYVYGTCTDATAFSVNEMLVHNGWISLAPNPVKDEVIISLSKFVTIPKQLTVRDYMGRMVQTINIVNGANQSVQDFSHLPAGVYTIRSEEYGVLTNAVRFVKM